MARTSRVESGRSRWRNRAGIFGKKCLVDQVHVKVVRKNR